MQLLGCSTSEKPFSILSSHDPLVFDNPLSDRGIPIDPSAALQASVARQIAARSLRRWDGFLGFRAGHDGLGNPLGVWKDKFDGVRFAVLMLAMRQLNEQLKLQRSPGQPGKASFT